MKIRKHIITLWLVIFSLVFTLPLSSCSESGKKERLIKNVTDNLRTSYMSEITFSLRWGENSIDGTAILSRDMAVTRLDITSPEPYSGLSVEYDITGVPSSVEVHFAGIDTTLPKEALSKINLIASLAADDFLSVLSKAGANSIRLYEIDENTSGYCAKVIFGEAETEFCFSDDGSIPYSLHYFSDKITADIVFTKFKLDLQQANE